MSQRIDATLTTGERDRLRAQFAAAWPQALALWGSALRLHEPQLPVGAGQADAPLAWFSLADTTVTVDLAMVHRHGLADVAVPLLAHEIGHHVCAPASRADGARILARVRAGLGDRTQHSALVANLWADTLVNDRLQRSHRLPMDQVYRRIDAGRPPDHPPHWALWMRAFELLWALPAGTLTPSSPDESLQRDAWLLARHTRVFAADPVAGAGGFAAVLRPWLPAGHSARAVARPGALSCAGGQHDALGDTLLPGLAGDDSLGQPVTHPALDPRVNPEATPVDPPDGDTATAPTGSFGQAFGPAQLAQLYAELGSTRDAAVDFYLARARRQLVPFPVRPSAHASTTELQGWQVWELGDDLTDLDWLASMVRSPLVVPGLTTQRRVHEPVSEPPGAQLPLDLDLYVDCSGSMPDPRRTTSPVALCGAILALSCLRVGGSVQVTIWSSPGEVARTAGFVRDETQVVATLLTYFGGGTTFPLRHLRADHPTGRARGPFEHPVHIASLSDSGVTSMFGQGQPAELAGVAHAALASAGGGGSLILNVGESERPRYQDIAGGYAVYAVPTMEQLVPFARAFAARTWGDGSVSAVAAVAGSGSGQARRSGSVR